MKSNNDIFVQYRYQHGPSFSMNETIDVLLEDHKAQAMDRYELWIEDDEWLQLPHHEFMVTTLTLDKSGNAAAIQFTERYS
jgi:hypothetical protein